MWQGRGSCSGVTQLVRRWESLASSLSAAVQWLSGFPLKDNNDECLVLVDQWFSNWGRQSFWGPWDNFVGTAENLTKKSTRCSWRKKLYAKYNFRAKMEPNIAELIAQKQVHLSHWYNKKPKCCFMFICVDFLRGLWAIKKIARGPLRNFLRKVWEPLL